MGARPGRTKAESVGAVVDRMGLERRALLASRTAVVLLQACAFLRLLWRRTSSRGISRTPCDPHSC